jgi:diguanylate cyclase (GGDEF)-like protein/PAS domain S-box-containing protein
MAQRRGATWEQYRLIADNSSDVVYETEPGGHIRWIQPTVESLLGWTADELRGVEARSLVHPDDLEMVSRLRLTVYDGAELDEIPCRFRTASGGHRRCTVRARPLRDAAGNVSGAVMALRDVHSQTAALRALATLSSGNEVLVRAHAEGDLLERMCDAIVAAGEYPLVWYGRPADDEARTIVPAAAAGAERAYLDDVVVSWGDGPLGQGPSGIAVRTRTAQVRNDVQSDPTLEPWFAAARRHGIACTVSLPVLVDGEVDGVLAVYAAEPNSFDDLAETLLGDLAADIGFGVGRLRDAAVLEETRREAVAVADRLRATIDSLIDPFVLLESVRDADGRLVDLRYAEANKAAVAYNQRPYEDLIGATMLELFPGLLEHGPLASYFHAIETGIPMVLDDVAYGNEILRETRHYDLRGVKNGDGLALTWRDVTDRYAERAELARSQEEFRLLAENATDFVMRSAPDGTIEWVSPSATRALGWSQEELVGSSGLALGHPDDVERARRESAELNAGRPQDSLYRVRCKDGGYRWFRLAVRPVTDSDGTVVARVSAWSDVQAEMEEREAREASEGVFRKAMQSAAIGMAVAAVDGHLTLVNPALCTMLGLDADSLVGVPFVSCVHPDDRPGALVDRAKLLDEPTDTVVSQLRLVRGDGTPIWVRRTAVLVRDADGEPDSIVLQIEDVTAERRARDQLAFQAFHDPLTGLRNRAWVVDMLESDLAEARRAGKAVGVLYVDLDNFKVVNESLGHQAGDEMLASVARRIAAALSGDFRIGRFGGDEFLVVIPEADGVSDVEAVAERVADAVAAPLTVAGHNVVTSASIGVAMSTEGSTPESLLRDADSAVYRAKSSGRARWHFFDDAMHAEAVQRLLVEDDLRRALATDELTAYFQPVVDLSNRKVVGHEALVRWVHPERGVLSPFAFLTVAEESGLVVDLGQKVLESVCRRIASTPALPGTVSVNVSAVQLGRTDWAQGFLDTVRRFDVDPARIVIEVTETAVLSLLDSVRDELVELRALGMGVHVDDFGTGYSSIALLRDLPVTGLKLDRSFVNALTIEDSQANALSSGLAALSHSLRLTGVAEGVETDVQAAILRAHGWSHGQGYLFGRPEPEPLLG